MEAHSSNTSTNQNTNTKWSPDASTKCISEEDMGWEWGVRKDPKKQHLTYIKQVSGCPEVTTNIQRSANTSYLSENEDEEDDEIQLVRDDSRKRKFVCASNPTKEKLKMIAWKKFAIWAYTVGLPLNAVCDESFQDVINAIGDYGRGMPAPSYCDIRVTLFKDVLEDTKNFVDSFRPQWQKYRCSIMSDFWTDEKGRCLINLLVNCSTGTIFLKSIDASEHVKDAQLIMKVINEVIEDVGEENIVQFITNNDSNFKVVGKILEQQHPKLFWTPCAASCVNLIIGDVRDKISKIKSALSDARAVVVYIYNHKRILNMMRKLTKNKELHIPCVTSFATQFYTLQSVHENRHHVQVLFVSEQWTKSDFAKKAVGKRVQRIVAKHEFWDNVYLACQVIGPLVDLIRLVDTQEKPCMGYIYDAMNRAKEQISKNLKDGSNERLISKIWSIIQTRWTDQFPHPLHTSGFFLNPAIFHGENSKIEYNREIMTGLCAAIDCLVPDEDENDTLRQQLNLYIDSKGQFGSAPAKRNRTKVAPYVWWHSYGIDTPLLQTFAMTVLGQTCSASPCVRNWSAFDNLHSKKRNCLLQQKLNDLMFIQYNTRLQRRSDSLKNYKIDPLLMGDVEEDDGWTIPTEDELQDFVNDNEIRNEMEDLDLCDGLDEEVNALDDVDSDAERVDCS